MLVMENPPHCIMWEASSSRGRLQAYDGNDELQITFNYPYVPYIMCFMHRSFMTRPGVDQYIQANKPFLHRVQHPEIGVPINL